MGKADIQIIAKIAETNIDKRQVFGWASIIEVDNQAVVDYQEDIIKVEQLEEAVYPFVKDVRQAGEMHEDTNEVGTLIESMVFTKEKQAALGIPEGHVPVGWWVGFELRQDVFEKVKSGEYKMFSIGGKAQRVPEDEA